MAHVVTLESAVAARRRPQRPSPDRARKFTVVIPERPLWPSMQALRGAMEAAREGECVAFGVPLDTPLSTRLITLATFRLQRRRAIRAIRACGGVVTGEYGVDPSLERRACVYEVNTPASQYAERFMRPRGTAVRLRRIVQWCFGCDPALGGVMVVGRKS
jgi:hypothetical protein